MAPMLLSLALLAGCDDTGQEFRPQVTGVPAVRDLGELPVITQDQWSDGAFDPADPASGVVYSTLGVDEDPAIVGGATFQFEGNGGYYCVVMDPGNVFWNASLTGEDRTYTYVDNYADDGDLDMDVGLSAYYTGSPGVAMGDFNAVYTDPSGVDHTLAFNECVQTGYLGDSIHPGRANVEFCEIDTDQRNGIFFTGALHTFMVPTDDSILDFAVAVFEVPRPGQSGADASGCAALTVNEESGPTECTFKNEVNGGVVWEYSELEQKFCDGVGKLNTYCEDHLEDENPPCSEPSAAADPTP